MFHLHLYKIIVMVLYIRKDKCILVSMYEAQRADGHHARARIYVGVVLAMVRVTAIRLRK